MNGTRYLASGTGAAATLMGAMIALLNDYLASQGQTSVGLINPLLYQSTEAILSDITTGTIGCGATNCEMQYSASEGWDPVSGLGTLDYVSLLAEVLRVRQGIDFPTSNTPTLEPTHEPTYESSSEPSMEPSEEPSTVSTMYPSMPSTQPISAPPSPSSTNEQNTNAPSAVKSQSSAPSLNTDTSYAPSNVNEGTFAPSNSAPSTLSAVPTLYTLETLQPSLVPSDNLLTTRPTLLEQTTQPTISVTETFSSQPTNRPSSQIYTIPLMFKALYTIENIGSTTFSSQAEDLFLQAISTQLQIPATEVEYLGIRSSTPSPNTVSSISPALTTFASTFFSSAATTTPSTSSYTLVIATRFILLIPATVDPSAGSSSSSNNVDTVVLIPAVNEQTVLNNITTKIQRIVYTHRLSSAVQSTAKAQTVSALVHCNITAVTFEDHAITDPGTTSISSSNAPMSSSIMSLVIIGTVIGAVLVLYVLYTMVHRRYCLSNTDKDNLYLMTSEGSIDDWEKQKGNAHTSVTTTVEADDEKHVYEPEDDVVQQTVIDIYPTIGGHHDMYADDDYVAYEEDEFQYTEDDLHIVIHNLDVSEMPSEDQ